MIRIFRGENMKKQNLFALMLLATLAIQPLARAEEMDLNVQEDEHMVEISEDDLKRISADLEKESKNHDSLEFRNRRNFR